MLDLKIDLNTALTLPLCSSSGWIIRVKLKLYSQFPPMEGQSNKLGKLSTEEI